MGQRQRLRGRLRRRPDVGPRQGALGQRPGLRRRVPRRHDERPRPHDPTYPDGAQDTAARVRPLRRSINGKGRHEKPGRPRSTKAISSAANSPARAPTGAATARATKASSSTGACTAAGRYTDPGGNVYEGTFVNGEFDGKGTLTGPQGNRYTGDFKQWRFNGQGELRLANGDVYRGGFANGNYDGQGTLTFAKPQPDGTKQQSGLWRFGMLEARAARAAPAVGRQRRRPRSTTSARCSTQAIDALAPREPGRINLFLLAVGGDGSQEVFRREVEFVRGQFAERFGTGKRTHRAGQQPHHACDRCRWRRSPASAKRSPRSPRAWTASQDILFVFLTSHGSREHELVLDQNGMDLPRPARRRARPRCSRESGIRWKVVVISACYAGGFLDPLKDDGTLVITAARARPPVLRLRRRERLHLLRPRLLRGSAAAGELVPGRVPQGRGASSTKWKCTSSRRPRPAASRDRRAHSLPQMPAPAAIEQQLQRWWTQNKPVDLTCPPSTSSPRSTGRK